MYLLIHVSNKPILLLQYSGWGVSIPSRSSPLDVGRNLELTWKIPTSGIPTSRHLDATSELYELHEHLCMQVWPIGNSFSHWQQTLSDLLRSWHYLLGLNAEMGKCSHILPDQKNTLARAICSIQLLKKCIFEQISWFTCPNCSFVHAGRVGYP